MSPSTTLEQVSKHHAGLCGKAFQKNPFFFFSQSKESIVWGLGDTRIDWQMYLLHRKISPHSRFKLNFTSQDCSKVCVMAFSRYLQTCVILCLTSNWHLFFFSLQHPQLLFSAEGKRFQTSRTIFSRLIFTEFAIKFSFGNADWRQLLLLTSFHKTDAHEGAFHQGATMSSISSQRVGCFSSLTVGRVTYFCFTQKACRLLPV